MDEGTEIGHWEADTVVGSTIVYAFMQAVGMVNDHLVDCSFRRV
ncbi:DNA-3-methyladenine glycosylase I [Selenomonas artemidis]